MEFIELKLVSDKILNLKSFLSRFIFVFSTYELETITSLGFILAITEETFSIVVDNVDTLPVEISTQLIDISSLTSLIDKRKLFVFTPIKLSSKIVPGVIILTTSRFTIAL